MHRTYDVGGPRSPRGVRRLGVPAVASALIALVLTLTACGADAPDASDPVPSPTAPTGSATTGPSTAPTSSSPSASATSTRTPGKLKGPLLTPDVLVTGSSKISDALVARLKRVRGVRAIERLSVGSLSVEGRTLTVAAVNPSSYRRFTPVQTAQADDVWARVANGEVAVDPQIPEKVVSEGDMLALGDADNAETVHVGAYAPLSRSFSAVVNDRLGEHLNMQRDNALLISTGRFTPSALASDLRRVLDGRAVMRILALEFDVDAVQTALLTGTSVAAVVGSFSYRQGPNGTIQPDSGWVSEYIRTESVPILGNVTCNKAMLPQLRAALNEVVQRGLADKINPNDFGGCYYPRYIGRDPANGLSLHSWGIAVDLNVQGNLRGTVGEIDRQVVAIFEKWGFSWGGNWSYTDPMHFELNRVVDVG